MRHTWGVLSLVLCALCTGPLTNLGSPKEAHAQGFDAERFVPAAGAASDFTLESPVVLGHLDLGVGLFLNFADDPLVLRDVANDVVVGRPVDTAFSADLAVSLGLWRFMELGLHLPVHLVYEGDVDAGLPGTGAASRGIGDLRLVPKFELLSTGDVDTHFVLGASLPVSFPTGDDTAFRGAGGFTITPSLSALLQVAGFGLSANLGYMWRQDKPANVAWGNELRLAIAASYELSYDGPAIVAELNGGKQLGLDIDDEDAPTLGLEALAGVRVPVADNWKLFAGGGLGVAKGLGTPDFRIFGGFRYATHMPSRNGFGDSDDDGISDRDDECPSEPEDHDGFQDEDGCPEPDNDSDGILDDEDECPELPDDDNDGDGCPSKTYVKIEDGRIVVFGKVQFRTGSDEVSQKSEHLLDQVAVALKANPDVHVRVSGHTDNVGGAKINNELSEKRAQAVKRELVKRGIDEDRLSTQGYGERKPIAPNSTKTGRTKNRRVEFHIIRGDD